MTMVITAVVVTTADILASAFVAAGGEDGGEVDKNDNNKDVHGGGDGDALADAAVDTPSLPRPSR